MTASLSDPTSPAAVAEADEFLLEEIFRDLNFIWSYAASAMEAARRGDRDELRLRLRIQLRDHFRHAAKLHDLLSTQRVDRVEKAEAV